LEVLAVVDRKWSSVEILAGVDRSRSPVEGGLLWRSWLKLTGADRRPAPFNFSQELHADHLPSTPARTSKADQLLSTPAQEITFHQL
jgi:hypothetical protein